jgi:DnaJ-class molecular chaperone
MSENFYNVLGVDEKATKDEIKKAFRSLSMKYHPDKNPGDPSVVGKFQKIGEAYETLGDDQKRQEYDMARSNPFMRMNSNHGPGMEVPIDEIFNAFFGGGGMPFGMHPFAGMPGGPRVQVFHNGVPLGGGGMPPGFPHAMQKPQPIVKTLNVSIDQILTGANVPVDIERWIVQNGMKVFEQETIYVTIPKGSDDNEIILLKERGNVINDNNKGDIKIIIKVENNTSFKRSGLDLILERNITLKEALCGFSFEIKYLNGKSYTLNNTSGNIISPEYKKIIPKMGLTRDDHTGNLIIIFHISFPEKLSEEQIKKLSDVL